ncbi:unnamed protein product [Spirodela intermedia]|uniref:Uncharacterized protein n=2 Tax=Spirodela intermedia TaxID=51605 RepID=A0A7I8L986_SPIIN|nr:unnamed protein product [Spirodela intermedia]CAA6668895.1 unnamed protein product [Spirodela intermedia]CAA7405805.1 unnamed protein product [Spirodela intermedia]
MYHCYIGAHLSIVMFDFQTFR